MSITLKNIKNRNSIIRIIRGFFSSLDYLEVETPILSPTLIPESNIEVFSTTHVHPFRKDKESYLIPSPEIWLKKFLSENNINVFEISKCFRNSEQSGKYHNPEFTMIEYYSMGFNHKLTLDLTKQLLDHINSNFPESKLPKNHKTITMEEAFIKYADFSLKDNQTISKLHYQASKLNIPTGKNDNWETAFNRIFIDKVEPSLPADVNLFLIDFPSEIKTLAKNIPETPWAERWELYINGIECGNCYTEERTPDKIRDYFDTEGKLKNNSIVKHKIDNKYSELFKTFPECSGGAIGLDRLIMAILGIDQIQGVILFPDHDNIK